MKMIFALTLGLSLSSFAADRKFDIVDGSGKVMGHGILSETKAGAKLALDLKGAAPGAHAMHIHEKGNCVGPKFETAGAHFNPTQKSHGHHNPNGHHLGDLENIEVAKNGDFKKTIQLKNVKLSDITTESGTSLVIHAKPDDGKTDPSGNSGDRIYCGVLTEAKAAAANPTR